MLSRLSLFAAVTIAVPPALAGVANPYFTIDNINNTFYAGQVGVNGSDTPLQVHADTFWGDLASYNGASVLATDITNSMLYRFSTSNGAVVGSVSLDRSTQSIAYDFATHTLYGLAYDGNFELYTIDMGTGVTTTVGAVAVSNSTDAVGLGYDPVLGAVLMTTSIGELYTLSTADASASLIGNLGLSMPFDIAYNPIDTELYVVDAGRDAIFRVDRSDASISNITTFADSGFSTGLAFLPSPGAGSVLALGGLAMTRRRR